ncbi:hypothetical protein [Natronolimnobius baerhuensis]|uniref:Uncharacterized protein n=1 Tax=Natronolimnobius baerhuensis TaxID=253108 RepID=A0A202EBQ3_9EURY|nr:hypothetical protein [Natronolimnobius baerhuensis]OVE85686.1 hypothetical protein B2G88_02380 [Natronolimnobius baerhuensis]
MAASLLEWVCDEDGDWTTPTGRRGELVALVVTLPVALWFVTGRDGFAWPQGNTAWLAATVGLWCGYAYAVHYREPIVEYLLEKDIGGLTLFTLFSGGLGISALEFLPATGALVVALLVAAVTIIVISLLRLVSPLHRGLEPARRGVEVQPPERLES